MTVFENGKLLVDWTLQEIRERAELDFVIKVGVANDSDLVFEPS